MADKKTPAKKQIQWEATETIDPPEDADNDDSDEDHAQNTNWLNKSWLGQLSDDLPPLEPEDKPSTMTQTVDTPQQVSSKMSQILPNLYVGDLNDAKNTVLLEKNKISSIISVYTGATPLDKTRSYLCISAADNSSQNICQFFPVVNDFIHYGRSKGAVLVQCLTGISSSVTLITAYIMTVADISLNHAKWIVNHQRQQASPNIGFARQLVKFEIEGLAQERQRFRKKFPLESDKCNDKEQCESILVKLREKVEQKENNPTPA